MCLNNCLYCHSYFLLKYCLVLFLWFEFIILILSKIDFIYLFYFTELWIYFNYYTDAKILWRSCYINISGFWFECLLRRYCWKGTVNQGQSVSHSDHFLLQQNSNVIHCACMQCQHYMPVSVRATDTVACLTDKLQWLLYEAELQCWDLTGFSWEVKTVVSLGETVNECKFYTKQLQCWDLTAFSWEVKTVVSLWQTVSECRSYDSVLKLHQHRTNTILCL